MTDVEITSNGHQVKVSHEGADLVYVVEKAQELFKATCPQPKVRAGFDHNTEQRDVDRVQRDVDRVFWGAR